MCHRQAYSYSGLSKLIENTSLRYHISLFNYIMVPSVAFTCVPSHSKKNVHVWNDAFFLDMSMSWQNHMGFLCESTANNSPNMSTKHKLSFNGTICGASNWKYVSGKWWHTCSCAESLTEVMADSNGYYASIGQTNKAVFGISQSAVMSYRDVSQVTWQLTS